MIEFIVSLIFVIVFVFVVVGVFLTICDSIFGTSKPIEDVPTSWEKDEEWKRAYFERCDEDYYNRFRQPKE